MADHISAWFPEQDQIRLAVLGKLIEECGELAARAARCITHGLDEQDSDTGRGNAEELQREMADVQACLDILSAKLDLPVLEERVARKSAGFRRWHELIEDKRCEEIIYG